MNRREVLVTTTLGITHPLAGCLTAPVMDDQPELSEQPTEEPVTSQSKSDKTEYSACPDDNKSPTQSDDAEYALEEFTVTTEDEILSNDHSNDSTQLLGFAVQETPSDTLSRLCFAAHLRHATISENHPAKIEFEIYNRSDETLKLLTGAPPPFGAPVAKTPEGTRLQLWSDRYEESNHVSVEDGEITHITDLEFRPELKPDETIRDVYEIGIDTPRLTLNTYTINGEFGYEYNDQAWESIRYQIGWRIETAE